jgi:diguanylate cyclase (GGDEF)-like protein/PAS domain S-box-containing protein
MDTPLAEIYDTVTHLAAKTLDTPIVLISLIDESRQWFISRVGWDATQTSRAIAFCVHVVRERQSLSVPDAAADARFAATPLVKGSPGIRAYLGVPLFSRDGHAIGTLCAIDTKPRGFGSEQLQAMQRFARLVQGFIDAQEAARELEYNLRAATEREGVFRDTFENAPVGIVHTSMTGQLLRINPRLCEMLGYSRQELLATSFIDITHPDDIGPSMELLRQMAARHLEHGRIEKRFLREDGKYLWTMLSVAFAHAQSGRSEYMISIVQDISESKRSEAELMARRDALEQEVVQRTERLDETSAAVRIEIKRALESERGLRESESRLKAITAKVPALIGYWNRELRCEFASEAYRDWNQMDSREMTGMTMSELVGERLFRLNAPYARAALAGRPQHFERLWVKSDGAEIYLDARYVPDVDEIGEVCGFIVLVTDITELRRAQLDLEAANSQLKFDSVTDYLTGLFNRKVFSERSEAALQESKANGDLYSLILLDLDDFKSVNDEFGHATGDEVLRMIGRVLKESLRGQRDLAARLGGEEFAVLCFGALDEGALHQIAERIRAAIESEQLRSAAGVVRITSSFGIALSDLEDPDWKHIYGRADAALYRAKVGGKNRIEFGRSNVKETTGRHRAPGRL